jgi:membrane-bound serine protease (ClpP class)
VALYIEFMAPGISVGGLTAGLCFSLFFWSRFLGGTAGWLEVVLFLAGLVFLAAELFVIPGFGVAGLTGILLLIVSLLMASQHHVLPSTGQDLSTLITSLAVIVVSFIVVVAAAFGMSRYFGTIPILNRFALAPPQPTDQAEDRETGEDAIEVGKIGVANTPLRPAGVVRFGERYVDVLTEGGFVDKGDEVKVVKMTGNRVIVRPV